MKTIIKKVLLLSLVSLLGTTAVVFAATNYNPQKKGEDDKVKTIVPEFKEEGDSIGVVTPKEIEEKEEEVVEPEPYVPFIPEIKDSDTFIDIDNPRDFSIQYDYTNAELTQRHGTCDVSEGKYVSTSDAAIMANINNDTAFPYGTYSADVITNGYDSGIVFGLSTTESTFWEGTGISYYFAFISKDGYAYLGKTDNGNWYALGDTKIAGFSSTTQYEIKILHRVDRIILFIDGEIYINYTETSPLSGTHWGIRFGGTGGEISNIKISSKVTLD